MVTLSGGTVQAIAALARLELSEDETALYAAQLSQILAYFQHLQTLDTTGIEITAGVLPLRTVLREDIAGDPLSTQDALANAAQTQDDQFRVNAVLEES